MVTQHISTNKMRKYWMHYSALYYVLWCNWVIVHFIFNSYCTKL